MFRIGTRDKADLWLVDPGAGRVVVKDYHDKRWWVRLAGRLMIARESRAYRRLGEMRGLPRFAGRVDGLALAVEYIEGMPLCFAPDRRSDGEAKARQLREILDRFHARGVVHGDLRGRENVIVDRRGDVHVVDLASAIWLAPEGWLHRALFRWLKLVDESAYLKWKEIVEAGPFTPSEAVFAERFRSVRGLWLHRRAAWRRTRGG